MPLTDHERLATLEAQMVVALEGVSNFRKFQAKMATFVDTHQAREIERDKVSARRARIHFSLLTGLITLIVLCMVALFTWVLDGHHVVSENTQAAPTHYGGQTDAAASPTRF